MQEISLKYGCNPNQTPARIYTQNGNLPVEVINGRPGYINFLDALNGWQLVSELKKATGQEAAASFKHVSPASAAVGTPLDEETKKVCFVEDIEDLDFSPAACAYARARGADRMSSFGDWVSLSGECDEVVAKIISREVSDGIIAPSYTKKALEILKAKRKGNYNIVKIDQNYTPSPIETKQVFGVTFEQLRNNSEISEKLFIDDNIVTKEKHIPPSSLRDLIVALITLKYTQSNSVCFAENGQAIGVGAGQQSRIHCTRLAAQKADNWHLRFHPFVRELDFLPGLGRPEKNNIIDIYISDDSEKVTSGGEWFKYFAKKPKTFGDAEKQEFLSGFTGVSLGSDAFFPFEDNIERAKKSGVSYIAQPGGSVRDGEVINCCDRLGITMTFTGVRLFHH